MTAALRPQQPIMMLISRDAADISQQQQQQQLNGWLSSYSHAGMGEGL